MGEKGSLKNRLKDFFKIQKKLLEKKKLEKKEKKKVKKQFYYSKPKIFIIKLLSYLGLCISYFFFGQKSKPLTNKNSSKKLVLYTDKKVIKNETKMKMVTKKFIPLQKEKININQKGEPLKNIKFSQNIKTQKQSIQKKEIKNINQQVKTSIPKKNISDLNNISKLQLKILKSEKQVSEIKPLKKITSQAIIIGALSSHLASKVSKEIIESLKYNKDEKEILPPNTSFDSEEQNLESKKEQTIQKETINNNIHTINQEQVKEENKKNYKQELVPFYIQVEEIKLAYEIIEEDLLQQEFEIEKLKEKLKILSEQEVKKLKLNAIKHTSFKLVNFFNPFHHFFKNTFISRLVHSILVNHKVKKMRRIIEKENKVKYYNIKKILKEISDKKDIIEKNILINVNTLEEINVIKNDLLKENSNLLEVIEILENLKKIEIEILEKNKKLQEDLEKTKQLEEKGKVKIKEFKNVA